MSYRGLVPQHSNESMEFEENRQRKSFADNQIRRLSKRASFVRQSRSEMEKDTEPDCTCDMSCKESLILGIDAEIQPTTSKKVQNLVPQNLVRFDPKPLELHFKPEIQTVQFQRVAMLPNDSHVIFEDLEHASNLLRKALAIRARYMAPGSHSFPSCIYKWLGMPVKKMDDIAESISNTSMLSMVNDDDDDDDDIPNIDPWNITFPKDKNYGIKELNGVFNVYHDPECQKIFEYAYPKLADFCSDMRTMIYMIADGPLKTYCYRRLTYLQCRFSLHILMNDLLESAEQRAVPTRDFYNIRKVDTHVHGSTCMNRMQLLRYLRKTIKENSDEVVLIDETNQPVTLNELFSSMKLAKHDLSVNILEEYSQINIFQRFDKYATKYNPLFQSRLREVYLSTDNHINGKYYGQIIRKVMSSLEQSKYQYAEIRLSIFGKAPDEWIKLAKWAINHNMYSPHVIWVMQVPRLYNNYKEIGLLKSFQEFLDNIFLPIFEATSNPNKYPDLHRFLQYVAGFDSVDDESHHHSGNDMNSYMTLPKDWTHGENPQYGYYMYYMYANIAVLNQFRMSRGLNTFTLCPHCGSAGSVDHLVFGYMMANNISHGIQLRKVPVLQYLYYLTQIGISMSPLSNNHFFVNFNRNPFPEFFHRGLNVCLSTDDPLNCHYTKEPLVEEYSIASQVWKLSSTDMAEIAQNSVKISGFPHKLKQHWLGVNYQLEEVNGNDVSYSNVPDIRVAFRNESRMYELSIIFGDET